MERPPTFIESARRAQIVAAAIDTIAELGYAHASLARIAERLAISKGVILYHFAGKDDLVRAVIAEVLARGDAFMRRHMPAAPAGRGRLRVYIQSNLAFMAEHRAAVLAVVDISRTARGIDGRWLFDRAILHRSAADLQVLLADLQAAGDLRADFDPAVMALAIRAAIDATGARLAHEPGLDVEHYARELSALFEQATGAPAAGDGG
jgi:AcrR family transcriptional regulator